MIENFVPSTQWQDVPDWAILPNGGEYRMDFASGKNQVRWNEPVPGPEKVGDKRSFPNGQTPSSQILPGYVQNSQPHFACGHSIAWYAQHPINPDTILLDNRYLCRTGGMFIVAPSGLGKSTLSIQLAVLWCCGLVAFGIKPRKALRILILQSEDDEGDCTEMAQVINHLGLSDVHKKRVWENSELIRCNDLVGFPFLEALYTHLEKARAAGTPFDLVIINPYSVFLGADVIDTAACMQFLCQWLNPILSEFGIAAVLIHHTAKTNFQHTDKYKIWDWMYHGAGCAGITNWARAIVAIKPETDDLKVFRFTAAKRGKRIEDWNGEFERYFAWSTIPGVLRWEDATPQQIAQLKARANRQSFVDLDKALAAVPVLDVELKTSVVSKIQKACAVGVNPARNALNELIVTGKAFDIAIDNPKKGRKYAGVTRNQLLVS